MCGIEFSEAHESWRTVPHWASFLIEFGFAWLAQPLVARRIAVITMPSDSAAAGLVALGAMRRCLELDDANDMSSHYEKLQGLARGRPNGVTLRNNKLKGIFIFDGIGEDGVPWAKKKTESDFRVNIPRTSALNWRMNGEAPVVVLTGQEVPYSQFYTHLVDMGGVIRSQNLAQSHSQVCLSGRAAGEAPTRDAMADVRFRKDGTQADLSQLLTVQRWLPGVVARFPVHGNPAIRF
jgi:hypothetical protein